MSDVKRFLDIVQEIYTEDTRYKPDAYEFLMQALHFTQNKLKRQRHISGQELLEGIREFSVEQYGALAKAVLNHWGITKTIDFGHIVFNLLEKKVLAKTETDSLEDFREVFDFEATFANVLEECIIKAKIKP